MKRGAGRAPVLLLALLTLVPPLALLSYEGGAHFGAQAEFVELRGTRTTILYTGSDSARARRYLAYLEAQPPLPAIPDTLPADVTVILAPDRERFDSILGGRVPEWAGGVALPSSSTLVIPAFQGSITRPEEAARILRHEWAHLGLYQRVGGLRAPRWFGEGYAEWAGGWDVTEAWRLRVALAVGTPSLDSLTLQWPSGSGAARNAYLLSASVVEYLVEASGERGLSLLFDRWQSSGSFEGALREVYGVTSGGLEEDWRAFVKRRYGWMYVLSRSMVFWSFCSLLLILIFGIRRRERRRRMERLRAQELPDQPAFWMDGDDVGSGGGSPPQAPPGAPRRAPPRAPPGAPPGPPPGAPPGPPPGAPQVH